MAALLAEVRRLEREHQTTKDALEIAKNAIRENRVMWEAERDALIAERDALQREIARLRGIIEPPTDKPETVLRSARERIDGDEQARIKPEIIRLIHEGFTVKRATEQVGISHTTEHNWRNQDSAWDGEIRAILAARKKRPKKKEQPSSPPDRDTDLIDKNARGSPPRPRRRRWTRTEP